MSILIKRIGREENLPLFNYQRVFFSPRVDISYDIPFCFPKRARVIIRSKRVSSVVQPREVDESSRIAVWKALFSDSIMPTVEEGAVEKYAGSLDAYLPENVPLDKVINHVKKG